MYFVEMSNRKVFVEKDMGRATMASHVVRSSETLEIFMESFSSIYNLSCVVNRDIYNPTNYGYFIYGPKVESFRSTQGNHKGPYISLRPPLARGGRPQGIAPTMVTMTLGRLIRTIVGAIPCGRPPLARGGFFHPY